MVYTVHLQNTDFLHKKYSLTLFQTVISYNKMHTHIHRTVENFNYTVEKEKKNSLCA